MIVAPESEIEALTDRASDAIGAKLHIANKRPTDF